MSPVKVGPPRLLLGLLALLVLAEVSCFPRRRYYLRHDAGQRPSGSYINDPNPRYPVSGVTPASYASGDKTSAGESYAPVIENEFVSVASRPISTFSADVDTASYSNVRRFLHEGRLPPPDAVRVEEMVNYFQYDYPAPQSGTDPVGITPELHQCPWAPEHYLLRVGVQARRIDPKRMPPRNLVFLVDVSGSMGGENRLPLVKKSLELLAEQLREQDRVAIVTYAGDSRIALPPTPGNRYQTIMTAVGKLEAGGSTNGGEGIQTAYKLAREDFIKGGVSRVILATDGDFNVGVTDQEELIRLIEEKRKGGVYLTVLGFGMGNLKDATLEKLAHHGNGHYAYVDSEREARKLFVEQGAALVTVAKDVKFQVEFNPARVASYRLIGYENRLLKDKDFDNDKKDAGDLGSGHTVTALYELVPPGAQKLKYQFTAAMPPADNGEWATVKLCYKDPESETSKLLEESISLTTHGTIMGKETIERCITGTADFHFAAAVAAFGMILRNSPHKGDATLEQVEKWAKAACEQKYEKSFGRIKWERVQLTSGLETEPMMREVEFIDLVRKAAKLKRGANARARGE